MVFIERVKQTFRRLQWKLTLSYTAVTVGTLLVVVFILGFLLFSSVLVPLDILNSVLSPRGWIQAVNDKLLPQWQYILSQTPIDTRLISVIMQNEDLQITYFDLFRVGDLQIRLRTIGQMSTILLDPEGIVLGTSNPDFVSEQSVGQPLDTGILPGLEEPLKTALSGELDPDRLFITIEPNERFYFAVPIFDEADQHVLGVGILYIESLPTENDLPANIFTLVSRSVLILLLAAGLIGTLFGALTAKGMVKRLQRVSRVTDAWSQGDFTEFIEDPAGDEISQLAVRLNNMAVQLQHFLKQSQEMAVSEERNRLARDLHDSAKQEALAASFHLGTALTLFDRDPGASKSHIIEADSLVDSVRGELTDLIHELRPPSMNGSQFDETVNEYIIEWAHQTGIGATFNVDGFVDISLEIKQAIYRIMQEALANVARHSSADSVEIALYFQDNMVEFSVNDDGVGLDTQQQHNGIGLDSMRERAESLDGKFNIESKGGKGTKIRVTFPIE